MQEQEITYPQGSGTLQDDLHAGPGGRGETNDRMRGETGQGAFRVGQREGEAMTAKRDPSKYKE